ncbi:MAG: hypothetical protein DWQ07_15285 [Chloroflexi bacterium]|nr:MAG: hypothetical protein DWQ07_15285 [Chloroflexota bacterium]MBL1196417.1 hypothetical protein [Chloroflexota bacterium]NOH13712.1 hypothetical protein [Chloroflexota bacterium]
MLKPKSPTPYKYLLFLATVLPLILFACATEPTTKEIQLVAEDIVWSQDLIEVEVGQVVRVNLSNAGALDHDLVIEEMGVDIALAPGESAIIELVFTEAGTFEYICSVPGHEEAGMVGEIVVGQ